MPADGNAEIESAALDYIRCFTADCSSYDDEAISGAWNGVLSLALGLDAFPRMLAQDTDYVLYQIATPVPTSASVVDNVKQTYSNQTWTSCDGEDSAPNRYGYQRCVTYQVKDQNTPPHDIQKVLTIHEAGSVVDAVGDFTAHSGPSYTNEDGVFLDGLALLSVSPVRSDACSYIKQLFTVGDSTTPIRVNCLHYTATDVNIVDVTSDPTQCQTPNVSCH